MYNRLSQLQNEEELREEQGLQSLEDIVEEMDDVIAQLGEIIERIKNGKA